MNTQNEQTFNSYGDYVRASRQEIATGLGHYLLSRQIQNINDLYEIILSCKHRNHYDQIDDLAKQLNYFIKNTTSDMHLIKNLKYNSSLQRCGKIMRKNMYYCDNLPGEWFNEFIPRKENIISKDISTQTVSYCERKNIGIQSDLPIKNNGFEHNEVHKEYNVKVDSNYEFRSHKNMNYQEKSSEKMQSRSNNIQTERKNDNHQNFKNKKYLNQVGNTSKNILNRQSVNFAVIKHENTSLNLRSNKEGNNYKPDKSIYNSDLPHRKWNQEKQQAKKRSKNQPEPNRRKSSLAHNTTINYKKQNLNQNLRGEKKVNYENNYYLNENLRRILIPIIVNWLQSSIAKNYEIHSIKNGKFFMNNFDNTIHMTRKYTKKIII